MPPYRAGEIDLALGRHPKERKKMAIKVDGKSARTHYNLTEKFEGHSLLECELDTGRTHQIRVHMQALGTPIVGDIEYGGQFRRSKSNGRELEAMLKAFPRQALHARKLSLNHPKMDKISLSPRQSLRTSEACWRRCVRLIEPDWEISGNVKAFLPVERMVLVKHPLILLIYPIKLVIPTRQLRKIVGF